jgi:hypothetical protein
VIKENCEAVFIIQPVNAPHVKGAIALSRKAHRKSPPRAKLRRVDCLWYPDCLMEAALASLDRDEFDCLGCPNYEREDPPVIIEARPVDLIQWF